jgi:hypothetical protein
MMETVTRVETAREDSQERRLHLLFREVIRRSEMLAIMTKPNKMRHETAR